MIAMGIAPDGPRSGAEFATSDKFLHWSVRGQRPMHAPRPVRSIAGAHSARLTAPLG